MTMDLQVVSVTDVLEVKPGFSKIPLEPGVVVFFDGRQCSFDLPTIGQSLEVLRPDGTYHKAVVGVIKEHGHAGRSIYIQGLARHQAPIGSVLYWPATRKPSQPVAPQLVNA